jgi:hypothetical protein
VHESASGSSETSADVRYTAAFGGNADNQPVIAGQSPFMSTPPEALDEDEWRHGVVDVLTVGTQLRRRDFPVRITVVATKRVPGVEGVGH